ncbi:MAG: AlkA N-terminal domain-containing protein [Jatrophihabitans sp.]|uniref:AlkA N-terminal domain-containing protein n=1 Tax=Jatrophihabitans sp. TaxID=1932789 RepID=UPI003F7DF61F
MIPDQETCYRAVQARDARFDGWFFTAVHTTGIYCRPSCPAATPRAQNVSFFPSAAAAQRAGFRACKRCRPDASPGSPEWDVRADVVGRALRLIADGLVDREGVAGLAARLGYSERQLQRVLVESVGAGALALARAQRAQTARVLLETTQLPITDIAFAAGFASVRQFNDTIRAVFATTPGALRAARPSTPAEPGAITLRLAHRSPIDTATLFEHLAHRAVPGMEEAGPDRFTRVLRATHGSALVDVRPGGGHLVARVQLDDQRDLVQVVARVRRLFDLDADPEAVDAALGADPALAPLVAKRPGLRCAGAVDGFETAIRVVIGQQVSERGVRTILGRLVAAYGEPALGGTWRLFPRAEVLAGLADAELPMPKARARTVRAVAAAVTSGEILLDPGSDRGEVAERLLALPGIGPWTVGYLRMRGLGDPDVLLTTDLWVRRAADAHGVDLDRAAQWAPWRSYVTHHLWATLPLTTTKRTKQTKEQS